MFTQPLILGSTYRLKFKTAFERHGICTTPGVTCLHPGGGVFRLEQITNFRDLYLAGIKLYEVFFRPLGFTQDEYSKYFDGKPDDILIPEYTTQTVPNETTEAEVQRDADNKPIVVTRRTVTEHQIRVETGRSLLKKHYKDNISYASYPIYKFVDVVDTDDIIWVPELTLAEFPEIDIKEYKDLSLVIRLGYIDDPTKIDPMLLAIRERMAIYGWRPSNIKLYTTGSKWMGPAEYDRLKGLRVPATIEVITPENKRDFIGETAIYGGRLKRLVNHVSDVETELDINTIMKQTTVLDGKELFYTLCENDELFATGDRYFIIIKEGNHEIYKLLKEGVDYNPGDICKAYRLRNAETDADKPRFSKSAPQYTPVLYGHNGDYPEDKLLMRFTSTTYATTRDTYPEQDKTYYLREGENQYRPAVDSDFVYGADSQKRFNTGVEYYEKSTNEDSYRQASDEEIADPNIVLYFREPDTYENDANGDYVQDNVVHEVYSLPAATRLMGYKFEYDDVFGQSKTITLQLEDIIDIALEETNVVLPTSDKDYNTFWKKYDGRRFRWTDSQDTQDPTQVNTLEMTVSEASKEYLSGKSGSLMGQSGSIYQELYIRDNGQQKRNYYMRYMEQSKVVTDQQARIAELERYMVQLQSKNESLETKNAALVQRVEELESQLGG